MSEYDINQAVYRKSTKSGNSNACVEVSHTFAGTDGVILVRDSKDRSKPPHSYTLAEWEAFVGGVKEGEFDL